MTPAIKGLFLGGGFSRRMGADKALLQYGAEPEVRRWQGVFASLRIPFYWSQRPEQVDTDQFFDIPRIPDDTPGAGPLAAIRTALCRDPGVAWLVLACDWPLLGRRDLEHLVAARDVEAQATAYVIDGYREPLCTLYEPQFFQGMAPGETSLSRHLQKVPAREVEPIDRGRFLNANDALTRHQASQSLAHRSDH